MLPIHSVLASGNPVLQWLPYILIGICAIALAFGFFYGFKRGFRLVSWNGLVWVIAAAAFFLLVKFFQGVHSFTLMFQSWFGEQTSEFLGNILLAILCVTFALVFYALFASLFPPRYVRVLSEEEQKMMDLYGMEMDDLSADFDDCNECAPNVKPEYRPAVPTGFERVLGGLLAMMNVLGFVIAIMSVILLVIDCTALKGLASSLYEVKIGNVVVMDECMRLIARFGMDFLFIGIVIGVAFKGKKKGLVASLRHVLVRWVGFVMIFVAVYLPFSPYATTGLIGKVVGKSISLMPTMLGANVASVLGKLFAAIIFIVCVIILRIVVDIVMGWIAKGVKKIGFLNTIDSSLSCLAYVLVGVIVCMIVWAGLYVIDYYNIFTTTQLFSENATISQGLFDVMETHLSPILNTITETIKGLIAKVTG